MREVDQAKESGLQPSGIACSDQIQPQARRSLGPRHLHGSMIKAPSPWIRIGYGIRYEFGLQAFQIERFQHQLSKFSSATYLAPELAPEPDPAPELAPEPLGPEPAQEPAHEPASELAPTSSAPPVSPLHIAPLSRGP